MFENSDKIAAVLLAICLVTSCMEVTNAQAATSKSKTTYYYSRLLRQKGGKKPGTNGYYYDTDDTVVIHHSKSNFINKIKRLNGLGLWITVRNGKVVEMSLHS